MSEQDGASTSRKKVVNKNTWKKTIRKHCRNKGLSYVNAKNKEVSEKREPSEVCVAKHFKPFLKNLNIVLP